MEFAYKKGQEVIIKAVNLIGVIVDPPDINDIYYVSYFDNQARHHIAMLHACQIKPKEIKD